MASRKRKQVAGVLLTGAVLTLPSMAEAQTPGGPPPDVELSPEDPADLEGKLDDETPKNPEPKRAPQPDLGEKIGAKTPKNPQPKHAPQPDLGEKIGAKTPKHDPAPTVARFLDLG